MTLKYNFQQLAYAPPSFKHIADMPSDAEERKIICWPGDLIVTATDGLFDNVPDDLILDQLERLPDTDEIMSKGKILKVDDSYFFTSE